MFCTILLELFLPFRPFKKTVNIRWTTISAHTRTKQNGRLLLRDKEARQSTAVKHLLKPLTAQRCSHRLNHWTIEPLDQNQEYRLLPADARQQIAKSTSDTDQQYELKLKKTIVSLTILGIRKDPSLWPLAIALLGLKIKFHAIVLNLIGLSTVFF